MPRILLTTLGSLGDLHPLIAIGAQLRNRGHIVSFCTCASYRTKIEKLGFSFYPLRPDATPESDTTAQLLKEIMDPKKGVERLVRGFLMPQVWATHEDLLRAATGPPAADLMVSGELVYPAPLIAQKAGIPWATYITAPMSFFSAYDLPILPPFPALSVMLRKLGPSFNRTLIALVKRSTRKWSAPLQTLRASQGLPPGLDPIYDGKFSPHLVLAIFSQVFAQAQPDWPANTVVTGFPFYDGQADNASLPNDLSDFLQNGEQPIVFTLGSSAVHVAGNFYEESAEAARLLKRRAVLLVGRNPPPKSLPAGVLALSYVGFSALFPRAAAVVHSGGVGTTGQALRAGCPMLVMPFNFDQPDNAFRAVRLGVGRSLSRSAYRAARAASELNELLRNPTYRNEFLSHQQLGSARERRRNSQRRSRSFTA